MDISEPDHQFSIAEKVKLYYYDNPLKPIPRIGKGSSDTGYSLEDLKSYTNNFAKENLIGPTQFGEVYRGKIQQSSTVTIVHDVTVKIWNEKADFVNIYDDYTTVNDEEFFLTKTSVSHHPNLVKVIGCCREGDFSGVVYDLNPLNTVHNLITKDSFTWVQRIKVALGFARLLEFLHSQEEYYVVQNIDAAHIMLDQEYNPRLIDFGLMHGGVFGEFFFPKENACSPFGYVDVAQLYHPDGRVRDVFSFGSLVLGLIGKRNCTVHEEEFYISEWAMEVYKPNDCFVHESLMQDPGFDVRDGPLITKLAMLCIDKKDEMRPTMARVVKCLEGLFAVKKHGMRLGSPYLCSLEDEFQSAVQLRN